LRALIQRTKAAQVTVDGQIVGQIESGLVVFLAIGLHDNLAKGQKLIDKLLKYRVFDDQNGKMGRSVTQVGGGILLVSQFTLYAQTHKGLRPDFAQAMPPAEAKVLFQQVLDYLSSQHQVVASGRFAADMQVQLINDGPVTFMLDMA
jgi:D-tyrosyl-tRNA(Tyr) deacylase